MSKAQDAFFNAVTSIITSPGAKKLGERLTLLADGVILPTGEIDTIAAAALLNMAPSGVKDYLARNATPSAKPGKQLLFSIADLAKTFQPKGGAK